MQISLIADPDTATGFRLAGIRNTREVSDKKDAEEAIRDLSSESGIIIITERIAEEIRNTIDEINSKKKGITPIIVEIPDKSGKMIREVDPIRALIRKAIGVDIE
ncbi:MAG: V-type ATP synthase subunit F [Candidatus Syntropharchaeia archaeon]